MNNFIKIDTVMKHYYKEYVEDKETPNKKEAYINAKFFVEMATGCRRIGLKDIGNLYEKRLNAYLHILKLCGWKYGSFGSKTLRAQTGLHAFLTAISASTGLDNYKHVKKPVSEDNKNNG